MILNLFAARPDHPLGDAKELKRVIGALPLDNSFRAVDEIYGWFESLRLAGEFRIDLYFDVVRQLDDAGQQHVRRLSRDYLGAPRLSKSEERRLWSTCYNYWGEVSSLYARCVDQAKANPKDKGTELLRPHMPLVLSRLVSARATQLKWLAYRYGPIGEDMWRGLGQYYLAADAAGYADKMLPLYPGRSGTTSVTQAYLQALMFSASSMDSLMPLEIDLADRMVARFLPGFVFSATSRADSVYWVDAASGMPPTRLVREPGGILPSMRFFSPGTAPQALDELIHTVERGGVPKELDLGGEYPAVVLLPVLRHLALYWAPEPPLREHARHRVKTRVAVLQGFDDCFTVFAGDVARLGKEHSAESWIVENVSLGGFGARIDGRQSETIRLGSLICLQPEGGENWVLGVVRRFTKEDDIEASVGVQSLSRHATSVELRPRTTGFSALAAIPGIWLRESTPTDEVRMVLPRGSFDFRESVEYVHEGRRQLLAPVELEESTVFFEIGRYRAASPV